MPDVTEFTHIPPTTLADILGREQVMDIGVRPLWGPTPRVAGPAFTVHCSSGDNLMLQRRDSPRAARLGHRRASG
jgi:4-hydroxy-4-methyl-2-oxoglutarate aldolase